MDKQTATQLIGNTFNYPFDEGRFRNFAINLLNDVNEDKKFDYVSGTYIRHSFKNHITKYKRLGTYTDPNGDKIDVLVVHLKNEWALERSRTMLRNFTSDYLKNRDEKDAALVAYYTTNPDDWRFSYIRMEYKRVQDESGKFKIKQDITPAKRYSFLVGKNEPNHTAQSQLVGILADDRNNPTLSELETAFSVDTVTKQFYKDYRSQFDNIWNELNSILEKDPKIATEFETKTIDTANFAKKLMGQIVFLYFLQKKGWLDVGKDDSGNYKEWGTGPKNFLRRLFNREFAEYKNFFNDVLEPLFYVGLASEHDGDVFPFLNCKVPFLNGGLFEPMNGYNWRETDIRIDNDIIAGVLDTFDQYNFTVREDEPLEKEVAVDPEMLGKVFENLLPENLRKGKGAYYTPRTIVHYMCQESLINYLDSVIQSSRLNIKQKQNDNELIYFDYESLTKKHKRNLPHWEQAGAIYFVTFRLWDSIPKEIADNIKEEREKWRKRHKIETEVDLQKLGVELKKEYYRLFSKRIDDLLDNGHGSCILKNPNISKIVEDAITYFDGKRYLLDQWVIMPNHVHILVKPLENWSLEKITHSWKSFTANEINKALKRDGQLWMHESFDHIVRSPAQYERIRNYIEDNPKNLLTSHYRLSVNQSSRLKSNSTILDENDHKQAACDTIPKEDIETLIREGERVLEYEVKRAEEFANEKHYKGKYSKPAISIKLEECAQELDDALANIKVCDPAIGSGAFPVGMLTEIVKARTVLSLYLQSNSSILLESGHEQDARDTYNLKRHCIQNSLYGVDIDPGAIEIAKLRLWLSLVVDEDDYTTIQPLPNLDYKIMQGNSLIEEFHGISLDIEKKSEQKDLFAGGSDLDTLIDDLHQKQDEFFNAEHPREKQKKRTAVETAIYNIFHNELEKKKSISPQEAQTIETDLKEMTHGNKERNFFPWKLYFADVFREKGGFDVVIANPPYIRIHKQDSETKKILKKNYFSPFKDFDIYIVFFELGLSINRKSGNVVYITPDKFLVREYGKKIRQLMFDNRIIELFDISRAKDIFGAATYPLITIISKKTVENNSITVKFAKSIKNIYADFNQIQIRQDRCSEIGIIELIPPELSKILKKIYSKGLPLGSILKNDQIFCGTPRAKDYYEWAKYVGSENTNGNSLRMLVCSNLKPYSIDHNKKVRTVGLSITKPYFQNRDEIISGKRWENFSFAPKILIRGNDTRITAVLDTEGSVFVGIYGIKIEGEIESKGNYILALLNSKLYQWIFLTQNPSIKIGGDYFSINSPHILKLPFVTSKKSIEKYIIKIVSQILTAKKANPQVDTTALEAEIDQLVYELYGLTEEEITIVEESVGG